MKRTIRRLLFLFAICLTLVIIIAKLLPIRTNAAPSKQFSPPSEIKLKMFALTSAGAKNTADFGADPICLPTGPTRKAYGCTWYYDIPGQNTERIEKYPFSDESIEIGFEGDLRQVVLSNTVAITIQLGYLHNVIAQEMSEGAPLASYTAQAIAARTYGYFQTDGGANRINNSANHQVYIPYRFEALGGATPELRKLKVHNAVILPGPLYMTSGSNQPINALFGADNCTSTEEGAENYLKSVYDPISAKPAPCDNQLPPPHQGTPNGGMGSKGAARWGYGNTSDVNNGSPWSVQWGDPPEVIDTGWEKAYQILTHYYTRIHIRNASGQAITPDFRWNILQHQANPPNPAPGAAFVGTVILQNTGVVSWPTSSNYPLYAWWVNNAGQQVTTPAQVGTVTALTRPGVTTTLTVNLTKPTGDPYTLIYRLSNTTTPTAPAAWTQPNFDAANTRVNPTSGALGSITTVWQIPAVSGDSFAVVADDTQVYYQPLGGGSPDVYSLATGQFRWRYTSGASYPGTLGGGRYIVSTQNYVAALNVIDGSEVWTQPIVSPNTGISPVVKNDRVYVTTNVAAADQIYLHSFNVANGVRNWGPVAVGNPPAQQVRFPTDLAVDNSKVYVAHQSQYQASSNLRHVSFSVFTATSGSRAWGIDLTNNAGATSCIPGALTLGGNLAFVGLGCNGSKIAAINLTTRSLTWLINGVLADTFTGEAVDSLAYTSNPAHLLVSGATKVWALDPLTGQRIWEWQPTPSQPLGANATVAGDYIWVASGVNNNWKWHVLSNITGAEISSWQAPTNSSLPNLLPSLSGNLLLFITGPLNPQRWALQVSSSTIPASNWFDQAVALQ